MLATGWDAVRLLSGVAALLHTRAGAKAAVAAFGALALLSAVSAMVLGVVLAG